VVLFLLNAYRHPQVSCPALEVLELKIGAQVVLLRNLAVEQGLCNGARGVVTAFASQNRFPIVRFATGVQVAVCPEKFTLKVRLVMMSRIALTTLCEF